MSWCATPLGRQLALAGLLVVLTLPVSIVCRGEAIEPATGYSLSSFWGETGEGPGQFHEPMGIAVGPSGELYVADTRNHRIQVLSPDGEFLREWGIRGEGPGEFAMPVDVAVGPGGSVYVSDYELDRVQKFTTEGEYRLGWGTPGEGDGEFEAPAGLLVGPDGTVYVADFYNHRVQIFDPGGRLLGITGGEGHGGGELYYPTDVALDAAGAIVVADAYNHRIHTLTREGATVRDWGAKWIGALGIGPFEVPSGVAIDSAGRVHVADSANKRAVLLDSDGKVLSQWELAKDRQPEMYSPTRVAVDGRRAYFVDTSNDRIVILEVGPRCSRRPLPPAGLMGGDPGHASVQAESREGLSHRNLSSGGRFMNRRTTSCV